MKFRLNKKTNRTWYGEHCQKCGRAYETVWWCDSDKLWTEITGHSKGNGLYCPKCFDRKARLKGIVLKWTAIGYTRIKGN